jgi:hypothetical protein
MPYMAQSSGNAGDGSAGEGWETSRLRRLDSADRSARARQTFHHQAGTAFGNMSNDGSAAMDLGNDAEIDGEGEVNGSALLQAEIFSLDENAVGAEIASAAQLAWSTGNCHVHCGACAMTSVEAPLHSQFPAVSMLWLSGLILMLRIVDILQEEHPRSDGHYAATHCSCEAALSSVMSWPAQVRFTRRNMSESVAWNESVRRRAFQ